MWGRTSTIVAGLWLAGTLVAQAADPEPEIRRPVGTPQAVGAVHTLRQIPEACVRLEGVFTGQADAPYRMRAVALSPTCQPRARFVAATRAQPSAATGWRLNDRIRVPELGCPERMAVVEVWRLAQENRPLPDGQGQTRIYLDQARRDAGAGRIGAVPQYSAQWRMQGRCGG